MNERVRRACANCCADFLYGFLEVLLYNYYFYHWCIKGIIISRSQHYTWVVYTSLSFLFFPILCLELLLWNWFQSSSKKGSEYWLIWKYEGEATLADLMLSRDFPYNVGTSSHRPFTYSISYQSCSLIHGPKEYFLKPTMPSLTISITSENHSCF